MVIIKYLPVIEQLKSFFKLFFLLFFIPFISYGQDTTKTDLVKHKVVNLYNQNKISAIYELADSSFQNFISQEKFVLWLNQTKQKLGSITKTKKAGVSRGFTVYQTAFQKGERKLLLAIDPHSQITGFAIRPVKPPSKKYTVQSDNPLKNAIDSLVEKEIRPYIQQINTVGISIGVLYHGKKYTYNYGEKAKGNDQLPTGNTFYEIGSVTKTFTATLLAEMVLQGKCKLDDPANNYLPGSIQKLQLNHVPITLRTLANHTSGLPRMPSNFVSAQVPFIPGDPYKNYDTISLFNYLDTVRLRAIPGTHFAYSNLGFGLLGTLLERISGKPYGTLLQQKIFESLGMNDTYTVLNKAQEKRFAQGYNENGKPATHWHFKALAGAGAIRSTVDNLLKYLKAHFNDNNAILDKAFRLCEQTTFETDIGPVGLAWFHIKNIPGAYWHNGGTGGFRSFCVYNKNKDIAIVILSNASVSVDKEGMALIKALSKK